MAFCIGRREFITLLGGAALAWPLAARAQQPGMPVIGFLDLGSPDPKSAFGTAFRQGLADAGYVPGQNVAIEFRFANNQVALLPRLAADLVDRKVAVIVTIGSPYAPLAAKAATSTIPIVFAVVEDPVRYGLVTSLSRPGGTATGMTFLTAELVGKQLNLLLELIPQATTIGCLLGPSSSPIFEDRAAEMLAAGRALGRDGASSSHCSEVRRQHGRSRRGRSRASGCAALACLSISPPMMWKARRASPRSGKGCGN
jgi:putative ABC transport system substrate-binding protein